MREGVEEDDDDEEGRRLDMVGLKRKNRAGTRSRLHHEYGDIP